MASAKQKAAFTKMLAGKKTKKATPTKGKQVDPTTPFPAPKTKGKGSAMGNPMGMGMMGASPMGKAPTASKAKGKKTALKIDIMLAKAMPGISMPSKKATVIPKKKKKKVVKK